MYKNLISAMKIKGVTIESIARVLVVHRNTVANKLDGESEFSFKQAIMIADTFFPEYRPDFLFCRTEEEKKTPA